MLPVVNIMMKTEKNVDQYISDFPKHVQQLLKTMRKTIRAAAPAATENMSYDMIGYKLNGKPLVYFGGWKQHIGFYATPSGNVAFKKELAKYKGAKGSVQFPIDEPLPVTLITKMIQYRVKENQKNT